MDKNKILLNAMLAYKRVCDKHITVYDQKGNAFPYSLSFVAPSWDGSIVGRKYVYLRNCNGEIARYVIKTKKIIVR